MITFDFTRILVSALSALIYGALLDILFTFTIIFYDIVSTPFRWKNNAKMQRKTEQAEEKSPIIINVIFIFLFGIGYTVISYVTLDGIIRLYTALFSLIGFLLPEKMVMKKIRIRLKSKITNTCLQIVKKTNIVASKLSKTLKTKKKSRKFNKKTHIKNLFSIDKIKY